MPQDELTRAALALWPGLAAEIGERPEAWQVSELARREDARVARILLRLSRDGADPMVLKHEARPRRPADFAHAMEMHLAAMEALPEGVPALLAADPEAQVCLMAHAPGPNLSVALRDGRADHASLLVRAGAWVSGFHRGGFGERRIFQPKFTLRYLGQIVSEVEAHARQVADRAAFLDAARALMARQAAFEGQQTVSARTHGDLHLRNLIVGPQTVWGIDFAGGNQAPVGHDIARLLVDYATLYAPLDRIAPGAVLPAEAQAAFFAGYDLVGADDPSVRLLLRHRVLADWWGLPAHSGSRSAAQDRRYRRLMPLAARVFAAT
ncbi:Phosphotransferase enzyme family protein [Roseivivax lentus]|uniref:Phosphotransferase enzyme family protein n=1 Tax=Roseivivax lentus TaxID=633194 RepID=A0A1N7JSK5_9RHOB|nr:phosphotransferase [Roseivivax lentus]SIS52320.1 Phosphotransferase enzyme family protein [Roseivivax lentus]